MRALLTMTAVCCLLAALPACERRPPASGPEATANVTPMPETEARPPAEPPGCVLTMGWDPWPPYHYEDPQGHVQGFDVEIVQAIAADLGCRLEFERERWATLLGHIEAGRVDLITGATETEARRAYGWFSEPFREEEFALYVRAGETDRWQGETLKQLLDQGLRLGVTDAYVYGDAVQRVLDDPGYQDRISHAGFGEANAGRLLDGDIDAFIEDVFVAAALRRRLGLENAITPHPVGLESGGEVRIMFSKATVSPRQVARANDSLAALKSGGGYEAIRARYLE